MAAAVAAAAAGRWCFPCHCAGIHPVKLQLALPCLLIQTVQVAPRPPCVTYAVDDVNIDAPEGMSYAEWEASNVCFYQSPAHLHCRAASSCAC